MSRSRESLPVTPPDAPVVPDDRGRGRRHRPVVLEVCVECCGLRGPHDGHDNLCRCDTAAWDVEPVPRCGDLHDNVRLCRSCVTALAPGSSRWSSYFCDACRPRVIGLNREAGRCVVPIGPHSIMNGVFHRVDGPDGDAAIGAFADQLSTLFLNQSALQELTVERTRARLRDIGVRDGAVSVDDYVDRCRAVGWDADSGFAELVDSIGALS